VGSVGIWMSAAKSCLLPTRTMRYVSLFTCVMDRTDHTFSEGMARRCGGGPHSLLSLWLWGKISIGDARGGRGM
jgi:hypothetical protein